MQAAAAEAAGSLGDAITRRISHCIWWPLHLLKTHRISSHVFSICFHLPLPQGFAEADHDFLRRPDTELFWTNAHNLLCLDSPTQHPTASHAAWDPGRLLINYMTLGKSQSLGWIITTTPPNSVLPRSPASHLYLCSPRLFPHWLLVGHSAYCA